MLHPFQTLQPEYERRLSVARVTRAGEVNEVAQKLLRPSVIGMHKRLEAKTGVPALWSACAFEREASSDFSKALGQGDRWDRVSVNVPRGKGPFGSWLQAAEYYEHYDHVDDNSAPWTMAYACWKWEVYNGFGPRDRGRVSGYVFAGTDQYDPPTGKGGKYVADGIWSPGTVDKQLGCAALALRMIELDPSLAIGLPIVRSPGIQPGMEPLPTPLGVGGGPRGTFWVQQSLNALGETPPLREDGSYGRFSRAAVRNFQLARGMVADGLVGPLTVAAIEKALGAVGVGVTG